VSLVAKCCQSSENPHLEVVKLLEQTDWRPHLVAAVALSVLDYDSKSIRKLWAAIDAGSWVTPQLAVAAFLKDPGFSEAARVRIEARCPVETCWPFAASSPEQDASAGPAEKPIRSAKAAASLVRLVGLLPASPEWLAAEQSSPDFIDLLSEDVDLSGEITESWLVTLATMLQSLYIKLD
jgi:hypothetical protein